MWNKQLPAEQLPTLIAEAKDRLSKVVWPWGQVYGPAAAVICTADRFQWTVLDAASVVTDVGRTLRLDLDPWWWQGRCMKLFAGGAGGPLKARIITSATAVWDRARSWNPSRNCQFSMRIRNLGVQAYAPYCDPPSPIGSGPRCAVLKLD